MIGVEMKENNKKLVVEKLKELGSKIELMESGPAVAYKKAAYFKAASAIDAMDVPLKNAEQLRSIKGIGDNIIKKVQEVLDTGTLAKVDNFTNDYSELLKIETVGPKKARHLFETYGVKSLAEVQKLIVAGKIDDDKLALNVRRALMIGDRRLPLKEILEISNPIELHMRCEVPAAIIQVCGSIRRKTKTCKDVDILICGTEEVLERAKKVFLGYDWDLVTAEGNIRIDAIINGVAVNGWFLPKDCYGSAVLHCTGSGSFNEALRSIAKAKGFKLSEYGLKDRETDEILESWSEEEIFHCLGYDFIPPQERTGGDVLENFKRRKK
jgi:DNA polymerase (family 10)